MEKERGNAELWLSIAIISIIALLLMSTLGLNIVRAVFTQRHETIIVNKSERINEDTGSRYLIYTEQGVYQNTDSWFMGKFNSSDLYNQIEAKKSYECLVTGWRNGFLSWYPNLIKCEEVK